MTLPEWLQMGANLETLYQAELGRSIFSDPEAFVNWGFWLRDGGSTLDGVRRAIRTSPEWKARHGTGTIDLPPPRPGHPPPLPPPDPVGGFGPQRVIRVTHESDGPFAPRMMSDRANAWVSGGTAYVFAGSRASGGPQFFGVDLASGAVSRLGMMQVPYRGETEGWYWTPDGDVMALDGPRLCRFNPFLGAYAITLDISESHPGCDLWQPHSADDGRTHSATIRRVVSDGAYPKIGTIVVKDGHQMVFAAQGVLDESQVSRDGRFVVIKEHGEDNRIIDLATGEGRTLTDAAGAIGHSDCGPDFIVGEANLPEPGRCVRVDLRTFERRTLFQTWNMGYVSVRAGRCLWSNDNSLNLVDLQSGVVTHLLDHGADVQPNDPGYYDRRPKGSLSPCGKVVTFMVDGTVKLLVLP